MNRIMLTAGMASLSLLALAVSHHAFASTGQPRSGGALTWGVETEPNTFNPQLNGQSKAELILRVAYESLLARKPDGGYIPWLATGYSVSEDGKTYTFTLRDDVKFSNGEKLNANAVAENFRHAKDPAYCAGSSICALAGRIESVATPDEHTVSITLKQVYSPFLSFAAGLKLISPSSWTSPQLKAGGTDLAGTGPFILKRYEKGQQIEYVRN